MSTPVVGRQFERDDLESFIETSQQFLRRRRMLGAAPREFEDILSLVGVRSKSLLLKPGMKIHRPHEGGDVIQHVP